MPATKLRPSLPDAGAVTLYREMATMGRALHRKQHDGEEPTVIEARQFKDLQNRCDAHPATLPLSKPSRCYKASQRP